MTSGPAAAGRGRPHRSVAAPDAGPQAAPTAPTDAEHALVLRGVTGEGAARRARLTIDGAPGARRPSATASARRRRSA